MSSLTMAIMAISTLVAAGSWLAILWADHAIDDEFVEPEEWLREELVLNDGEPLVIDYRH